MTSNLTLAIVGSVKNGKCHDELLVQGALCIEKYIMSYEAWAWVQMSFESLSALLAQPGMQHGGYM